MVLEATLIPEEVKAREQFERGVEVLRAEIIPAMKGITDLLPTTTLTIVDDYNKAQLAGKGPGKDVFPSVTLLGPKTLEIIEKQDKWGKRKITHSVQPCLEITASNTNPNLITISLRENRIEKDQMTGSRFIETTISSSTETRSGHIRAAILQNIQSIYPDGNLSSLLAFNYRTPR